MTSKASTARIEPLERRTLLANMMPFADTPQPTILFIRGATRSGGFLEGTNAATRNEQLADINNTSTAPGNAGWGDLAQTLRAHGFTVEQMTEAKEATAPSTGLIEGKPIKFENMDLSKYSAIVFGSNNARYSRASVDAIQNYVNNGGGALFISDANFGSTWRDSPDSDQQFLSRFGMVVNQDNGVYSLTRSGGDFIQPNDPVLRGVNSFDGEGVSPVIVPTTPPPGVSVLRVVRAKGQTRNNDAIDSANKYQGSLRAVTDRDAALVLARAGRGKVAYYFDRNTFFNVNGVGTDITQLDNRQLAINLFTWVADTTPPAVVASSFQQGAPSEVRITFNDLLVGSLTRSDILLRDAFDATPIPSKRWSWSVTENVSGQTELLIRIKGAQPPGTYQLQINKGRISDDGGNANPARIRFNFTISPS